mmetsp:Transcript_12441/g.35997  ORF Transcript_12441/g.35997 Transcript_12441/m.35997 type:complete len:222 (+) Transcript_12441:194-859(+)
MSTSHTSHLPLHAPSLPHFPLVARVCHVRRERGCAPGTRGPGTPGGLQVIDSGGRPQMERSRPECAWSSTSGTLLHQNSEDMTPPPPPRVHVRPSAFQEGDSVDRYHRKTLVCCPHLLRLLFPCTGRLRHRRRHHSSSHPHRRRRHHSHRRRRSHPRLLRRCTACSHTHPRRLRTLQHTHCPPRLLLPTQIPRPLPPGVLLSAPATKLRATHPCHPGPQHP